MVAHSSSDRGTEAETSPAEQERLEELRSFVEEWDFTARPDVENIRFAFHVARLIADTNIYKTRMYVFSKEFEGDELPPVLQLLLTRSWKGESFRTNDNKVLIERCDHREVVEAKIPRWDELQEGRNFEETVKAILANPEVLNGITPTRTYIDPAVRLAFEPAFFHDWGLEFLVTQRDIKVRVYGKQGRTESPTDFLLTYHNRIRVLAELVSQLALLALEHNSYLEIADIDMELLMRRLIGEEEVPIDDVEMQAADGLKGLAIERLIEGGHMQLPPKPDENDS